MKYQLCFFVDHFIIHVSVIYPEKIKGKYCRNLVETLSKAVESLNLPQSFQSPWRGHLDGKENATTIAWANAFFLLSAHTQTRRVIPRAEMKLSKARGQEICAQHAEQHTSVNRESEK